MRKPVIAGNWKMYKLHDEAVNTALGIETIGGECESLRSCYRAGIYCIENCVLIVWKVQM